MHRTTHALLFVLFLITLLMACGDAEEVHRTDEEAVRPSTTDTTELQQIYTAIDQHHEQPMAQYQQQVALMPAEARQMYDYMQQMHGQTVQMHHQMMGGMHGPGRMGRGMMGGLGMMDMLAMHRQMAEYLRRQGFDEMAERHEENGGCA